MNLALTQSYWPVLSRGLDGPAFIAPRSFLSHSSPQELISFLCGVRHTAIYKWQSSYSCDEELLGFPPGAGDEAGQCCGLRTLGDSTRDATPA